MVWMMLTFRFALVATALSMAILPSTATAASDEPSAMVHDLANSAAEVVAEEQALLGLIRGADAIDDSAVRLRIVDQQGVMLLSQFDDLGVNLTDATRAALAPLPRVDEGFPPPAEVYDAALADLIRIVATPTAVLPPKTDNGGPALGLLAVAAMSLLVLGAAALGNTLRRRESDEELSAMAWSDGLTGLANRRRLDHDVASQDLVDEPTAAIMIDVDHFKSVNDTFGHQEGDEVLRRIAAMLESRVRYNDVVYRYGGEEFCILLPGAKHADALGVAGRIVEAARDITLPDGSHVTVSVGIAQGDDTPASESVESADRALIAAKTLGRDRVIDAATLALTPA